MEVYTYISHFPSGHSVVFPFSLSRSRSCAVPFPACNTDVFASPSLMVASCCLLTLHSFASSQGLQTAVFARNDGFDRSPVALSEGNAQSRTAMTLTKLAWPRPEVLCLRLCKSAPSPRSSGCRTRFPSQFQMPDCSDHPQHRDHLSLPTTTRAEHSSSIAFSSH